MSTTRQQSTLASLRLGGGVNTYGKREVVAMLNEYKQLHNLDVFFPKTQQSCPDRENIERSELLISLKKSGMLKSKGVHAHMGLSNASISCNNN